MSNDRQNWRATPAEVIPFPARKRAGHIRNVAYRMFYSRTEREAASYWQRAIDGLTRQMEKAGVEPDRISVELHAFRDGVEAEADRLACRECQPGGSAA